MKPINKQREENIVASCPICHISLNLIDFIKIKNKIICKECYNIFVKKSKEKLLNELVDYKELMGPPYLQSQIDKRKKIEEWLKKKGRSQNDNFNKAIIAYFIEKNLYLKNETD